MKHKIMLSFGIVIFAIAAIYYNLYISSEASEKDDFVNLLTANNITVEGSDSNLTHFQLTGLIDEILDSDDIINKYEKLLSTKEDSILITAEEILELHYYSLSKEQRDGLIKKIANQKVDISSKNGAILISYNPN